MSIDLTQALARLETLRSTPVPNDLTAWAETFGTVDAGQAEVTTPGLGLLGLHRRAGVFPALLWNGSRIHRAASVAPISDCTAERAALLDGLTLLATVCGADGQPLLLAAAVAAGLREADRADEIVAAVQGAISVAAVTRWVPAAAVCAFVAMSGKIDHSSPAPPPLVDVAGALLAVYPPTPGSDDGVLFGHTLAAGWLATRLHAAGIVGVTEAFERTVTSVVGAQ